MSDLESRGIVAKTKALSSCEVTTQQIYDFDFAYAKISFSHDAAPIPEATFPHHVAQFTYAENQMVSEMTIFV